MTGTTRDAGATGGPAPTAAKAPRAAAMRAAGATWGQAERPACGARWSPLQAVVLLFVAAAGAAEPQAVTLHLDEPDTVTFASAPPIVLLWREVEDSRCPAQVVCVWEGQVTVRLAVDPEGGGQELVLTRQHEGDERATAATAALYRVRLEGVDPYPVAVAPTARQEYAAHLLVAPPGERLPDDGGAPTAVEQRGWGELKAMEGRKAR